jgi:osmotically-inducible protein OsmY
MSALRATFATLLLLSLTGCATLVAPLSGEPMDREHGERTFGAVIEDQAIETKIRVNLKRAGEPLASQRVVVVSFNGQVLLAGQVASDAM